MILLLLLLTSLGLTSCLKDKAFDNGSIQAVAPKGDQNVIQIGLSATNSTGFLSRFYDNADADTTINLIPVVLASPNTSPEDIHVTLVADPDSLVAYNDSNETQFEIPPSSMYTILNEGNVVTIPKGSNTGYLQLKFKPSDFIGGEWAFPFKIQSIDKPGYLISGNYNTGIAAIGIKNKYDGIYTVNGTLVDVVSPGLSSVPGDPYPFTVKLITTGASSVAMWVDRWGTWSHTIATGSYYGFFSPNFIFDLNTNDLVNVTNKYGQPDPERGRAAVYTYSPDYKYDEDTKSFKVEYIMSQGGANRTTFTETFTYKGPR